MLQKRLSFNTRIYPDGETATEQAVPPGEPIKAKKVKFEARTKIANNNRRQTGARFSPISAQTLKFYDYNDVPLSHGLFCAVRW